MRPREVFALLLDDIRLGASWPSRLASNWTASLDGLGRGALFHKSLIPRGSLMGIYVQRGMPSSVRIDADLGVQPA